MMNHSDNLRVALGLTDPSQTDIRYQVCCKREAYRLELVGFKEKKGKLKVETAFYLETCSL